ncbi:hypothetical protein Tco_0873834 [Tanacetum coccineum]|uniref:Uncharacterized protein n=1 Tax=Tanacetum coccineum TaxID=301880 RepID=A0ABQ5BKR0_9ASTR
MHGIFSPIYEFTLQVLSNEDLNGISQFELDADGHSCTIFVIDVITFHKNNALNVDQLQSNVTKIEFHERWIHNSLLGAVNNQFQKFIDSWNDIDADDADIKPLYDEEPMAEVQLTAECNIFAIGQQHNEQPEIIVEGRVDLIFTGHRFSPNKTSVVYEKTSPRSDLRWKPTGRIFESVGLRWIPTGKLFDSCTSKVDSESPHGSNVGISPLILFKPHTTVSTEVHQATETVTTSNELDLSIGPLLEEFFQWRKIQVVLKSSAGHHY